MSLDLEAIKAEIEEGAAQNRKTATVARLMLVNAEEIKKEKIDLGELAHKLGLGWSQAAVLQKSIGLAEELKRAGYELVQM